MSAGQNPMTHPDESLLAAFAEQALAGGERESVLAHLSSCARCREIVFLAQEPAAQPESVSQVKVRRVRGPWLRWQTATAGAWALALIAATVLLWQSHRIAPPSNEQAILHRAVPPVTPRGESNSSAKATPTPAPPSPLPRDLAQQHAAEKKTPIIPKSIIAGQSDNGVLGKPQSATPGESYIAPPAGAPEQQNAIASGGLRSMPVQGKQVPPQTQLDMEQGTRGEAGGKSAPAIFPASNTMKDQEPEETAGRQTALAAVPGSQLNAPLRSPQYEIAKGKLERLEPSGYTTLALPAGTLAQAVAARGNVVLLLTSKRALYRSTDYGEHWISVPVQWSGKAATLHLKLEGAVSSQQVLATERIQSHPAYGAIETKTRPAAGLQSAETNAALEPHAPASKASSPKSSEGNFELTNEAGKRWLSYDGGRSWRPEQE